MFPNNNHVVGNCFAVMATLHFQTHIKRAGATSGATSGAGSSRNTWSSGESTCSPKRTWGNLANLLGNLGGCVGPHAPPQTQPLLPVSLPVDQTGFGCGTKTFHGAFTTQSYKLQQLLSIDHGQTRLICHMSLGGV